ncbi:MAG: hypothetical protein Q7O66_07300 [Dehalococcoidia bacterium]|nr:hypothetical protein [Dehalococcoidia bacterium]
MSAVSVELAHEARRSVPEAVSEVWESVLGEGAGLVERETPK